MAAHEEVERLKEEVAAAGPDQLRAQEELDIANQRAKALTSEVTSTTKEVRIIVTERAEAIRQEEESRKDEETKTLALHQAALQSTQEETHQVAHQSSQRSSQLAQIRPNMFHDILIKSNTTWT